MVVLATAAGLGACRTSAAGSPSASEQSGIETSLNELYESFNFDAGGEADWERLRSLLIEGAVFVAPVSASRAPAAEGEAEFIEGFRAWIRASPQRENGFHERVLHRRIERFGTVAHAWVLFEGFVPGEERAVTRGLDSVQLVLDGDRWKVASFTTQFESEDLRVPTRFESSESP